MTRNATGGPTIVYGQKPTTNSYPGGGEYNNDASLSMFYAGVGFMDPRYGYFESNGDNPNTVGFQGSTYIPTINAAPSTASTSILAASQTPTANTALTLATASTTGLSVLSAALTVLPSNNTVASGALAIDGAPTTVVYRTSGTGASVGGVQVYDPTKAIARNIRIYTTGPDTAGSYLVSGYDLYGYPMTEGIAGTTNAAGATLSGAKAFKFVTSVVPKGTIGSTTVAVGTGDVIGFPMRADGMGDVAINFNATAITASTGFTAAVTTSPATSSTGDVRGTYSLQTASNGVRVLQVFQTPRAANLNSVTGLFGVTQA